MKSVIFDNLSQLDAERFSLDEKRLYELSELSLLLWQRIKEGSISLKTPYSFADGVEPFLKRDTASPLSLKEYQPFVERARAGERLLDLAALSLFLAERVEEGCFRPFPAAEEKSGGRIAYVPSVLSELAYTRIAKEWDTSVLYVSGASEAFAALSASEASFALLPLSSQNGERIASIERLARQHNAYIAATLSVFDGEREALFALFSLRICPFTEGEKRYLEWQLTANSYNDVSLFMSFVTLFGHTLTEYRCAPSEYGRVNSRVVLCGDGNDTALWFFLSLALGDFTLLGVYPMLSQRDR